MKKRLNRILSVFMTFALFAGVFICAPRTEALTEQQIREEIKDIQAEQAELQEKINKIKEDKAKQEELKEAIEKQMALVQKEIDACNQQINSINAKIEANQAEIDQKNKEIEENELAFKKRLRAIYMSNSDSNVRILLGAEDFSQFLELSQLTASVSAHDKLLIENIVSAIDVLNEKQEENNKLLQDQMAVKETITAKQNELKSQSNQIQSIISSLESQQGKNEAEQADNAALLKEMQQELNSMLYSANSGTGQVYDGGQFLWPVPSITRISSYFGYRWGTNHNGIDISNGTYGAAIVAIADGVVTRSINHCTHNYRKYSDCCGISGQGKGYGNHVVIDHGTGPDGKHYAAYYAHMSSVAVSNGQHVKKGQVIGYVGCTGYSTGPHLHFGLIVGDKVGNKVINEKWVDPMRYYTKVK